MSYSTNEFEEILNEIEVGLTGRNSGIPMGFNKLNKYIGIRKKILSLVFGPSGSGKTALVHDAWILNPFEWYIKTGANKLSMKVVLFSFERSKIYTKTKWLARKIFADHGKLIPIGKMLGWYTDNKLTYDEHDLIKMYEDYINELCEFVTIIEGADNPTGCYKYIKKLALERGVVESISEHKKVYVPNNSNEIIIPIVDHIGLTRMERGYTTKKEAIDKLTEYAQEWRDFYGYTPVLVAQITRELGGVQYQKLTEFEPTIDHIKESGTPGEAADVILSIFDPIRYNTTVPGYDANKLINKDTGAKFFRSLKILKNTYGEDSIRVGCAFHGAIGMFRELPKRDDMTDDIYQSVLSGNYFLQ